MTSLFILDDDPDCGILISKFATHLGISANYFTNPTAFLEAVEAARERLDVIVDLQMPDKDGIDVVEHLSSSDFEGRIFLMSGAGHSLIQASSRVLSETKRGIAGILAKPFSKEDLQALLTDQAQPVHPDIQIFQADRKSVSEPVNSAHLLDNLEPALQPKISAGSRKLLGFESLARVKETSGLDLKADEILENLKRNRLIDEATWLLSKKAIDWAGEYLTSDQSLAINFEPQSLENESLIDRICSYSTEQGLQNDQLIFEITEHHGLPRKTEILRTITKLRARGFGVAIDDFGIGFSSLRQYASFPFSEIKIDREFVSRLRQDPLAIGVVRAAIQLATNAGMRSTAEGVEDEETALALEAMGCQTLQGFWISKPLSLPDARAFARKHADGWRDDKQAPDGGRLRHEEIAPLQQLSVAIVDDEAAVRQTLVRGLSRLGLTCRPFCSGKDFLESLESESFDCCLLDFRMPDFDGLETLRAIPEGHRGMPVLVFTSHADLKLAVEIMTEGAADLIEKPSSMKAISAKVRDHVNVTRGFRQKLRISTESKESLATLTPREKQVAAHLAEGKSSKEIALSLELSPRTVEVHRANILRKTNSRNTIEFAKFYERAHFGP